MVPPRGTAGPGPRAASACQAPVTSPMSTPHLENRLHAGASHASGVLTAVKVLRKQWPVVAACVLVSVGGSLLYARSTQKIYQASSLLEIDPRASQPLGEKTSDVLDMGTGNFWDTRDYYETQYKIILSDHVLGAAVRDLSLQNDATFMKGAAPPGASSSIDDATRVLRAHMSVEAVRNSRLVLLKVEDAEPRRAQRICEAVANTYIAQNLDTALASTSDAVVWLNGQLDHVKSDLVQAENALHDFKQRNDLPSISINEASNMLRVEMEQLDTALTHSRTRRGEIAARYEELAKVPSDSPDQLPASELLSSTFLQSLRTQYQDAVKERASLVAGGKGTSHPQVRSADEKVNETRSALLAEVKNIQGAVQRDLTIISKQESSEAALFESTRKRAVDLTMKEIEYHRLDRSRDENEKLYGLLLEREEDADLARMMKVNNIRIVDHATEPKLAIRPVLSQDVGLGLLLGLLFGFGLAWVRWQMDSSIKTPDELEMNLGLPFLGLLPEIEEEGAKGRRSQRRKGSERASDHAPELVVHYSPLSGIAEAARTVRTNLLFMNPDRPYKKLLVSSAAPSEGKTTVACCIAIASAQGGQRVCIIDCDLRRPRLHRVFGRAGDSGITSVLVGEATLDEVIKPTVVENLWSIPAGHLPPNPADLLQSERFRRLLDELAERFDRVVIDSPPLVAVTDSAIISRIADGTVFVVRAFKTSRHLSAQGLRALRDVDSPVVGAVLNAVNLNRHEYSYYYHYYYYKRDGYRANAETETELEGAAPPN